MKAPHKHPLRTLLAGFAAATAMAVLVVPRIQAVGEFSRTYTLDADFDQGTLVNVNHETPNNNQLQLNVITGTFPFVNIAKSGAGTAVRVNVDTGAIVGEYLTAPDGRFRNPSRTTVDQNGNFWVTNRDEAGLNAGIAMGSMTRVGLIIGGTRSNADGTANPAGEYLAPPFTYNTCMDRDLNGLIRTSTGLGNVLPWSNAGGVDHDGGVDTAADECIINYTRTVATRTRTVAIDASNDVWVGGDNMQHEKIDGSTGARIPGTSFNQGCGGYGGFVDGNGILWSARFGNNLLRFNTTTTVGACLPGDRGNYGLGVDPNTGEIWHTTLDSGPTGRVAKLDALGNLIAAYSHGNQFAQGVAVDSVGNVWVAHSLLGPQNTVGHLRTDGTFVGNVPVGSGPTGVAVDTNGKIWVTNYNSHTASRIDPTAGPVGGGGFTVGAVDLTVNLGVNAFPYNYSDMTGAVSFGATSPSGTWTVTTDSGEAGTPWGTATWTADTPAGTSVSVQVRAADNQIDLPGETFVTVTNGVSFDDGTIEGRFIEIRTTLARDPDVDETPVLFDLTIAEAIRNQPPTANAGPDVTVSAGPSCTGEATLDGSGSSDPDGDMLTFDWAWPPAGSASGEVTAAAFPLGTTTVTLTVTDPSGASAADTTDVTVVDDTPPSATAGTASPNVLWPPNHQMVPVSVTATVADNCSAATCEIVSVSSNQPVNGAGDGNTSPDWETTGPLTLNLRAERSGVLGTRTYTIELACTDLAGNTSTRTVDVTVPANQGRGGQ